MTKFAVGYKHYHLEDNSWEVEHDVEADTPEDALKQTLAFYADIPDGAFDDKEYDYFGDPDNGFTCLTLNEAMNRVANGESVEFWASDADLFIFSKLPTPEDTEECSICHGTGRKEL